MAAHALPQKLAGRYEIKEVLGQGGMGLVYRAYDTVIRRDVALKTLRDIPEPSSLQLFYKESGVLASMSHPNIVEIFDVGEFEENGKQKPYFVMPLLPGTTLDNLIRNASHRLTVERTIEIVSQVCRGLQAAHERGLVHRDLKPSNIFVMEDDAVKIIDFGVAHMTNAHSTVGLKGTLLYMSPEQLETKPLSALSDIFSLSVVCYEALTGRQPFRRAKEEEIVDAIRRQIPPPVSELNSAVSQSISRVVHKGMAKQPWHRFSTAREFGETLNKALRNEPIDFFAPDRLRPRLERANRALEQGDCQFAGEILAELEAEGHVDSAIGLLRREIDKSARQKSIAQLLSNAKARFDEEEDPLALQKVQEILQLEPDNAAALGLKSKIESRRSDRQIESWYRLAQQHIANHAYSHAREALQNVLRLRPKEARAMQLLGDVDRQEQEYNKLRQEKVQLHRAAMEAWKKGDVSSALSKLALVLDLDRRAPDSSSPERTSYQNLYDQVRSEHDAIDNAYAEARKNLADHNFSKALALCDTCLSKYPNNALFQALKFDIEEQRRQELSAFIATIDRQVELEPDLDKRVSILKEALALRPDETHFERALRLVEDKRDLVNSIVARAQFHEEQGQFSDAISDWEILRTIYGRYPGLKFEFERLEKRREQQARSEAKARWIEQIDSCMRSARYSQALELLQQVEPEFHNQAELSEMKRAAEEGLQRSTDAQRLMAEGHDLCAQNQFDEGIQLLREAYALDEHNSVARAALANALVERAQLLLDEDFQTAEKLTEQALDVDPGHPLVKNMRTLVLDRKRESLVDECISRARRLQAAADFAGALARIEEALALYPNETRLIQMREGLQKEIAQTQRRQGRRRDLEELRRLEREAEGTADISVKRSCQERAQALAANYPGDEEVLSVAQGLQRRVALSGTPLQSRSRLGADDEARNLNATLLFSRTAESPTRPVPPPPPNRGSVLSPPMKTPPPQRAEPAATPVRRANAAFSTLLRRLRGSVQKDLFLKYDLGTLLNRPRLVPSKIVAAVAGGVLLLLAGFFILARIIHPPATTPPPQPHAMVTARIHTSPAGATIRINDEAKGVSDLDVKLPAGNYQIQADLDGYQSAGSSLELKAGIPGSVDLTLQPMLPAVKLAADGGTGRVFLDDNPGADLEGAQWTATSLAFGDHKLKFVGSHGEASFAFTEGAGSPAVVKHFRTAKGVHVVAVSNLGNRLAVYYSDLPAKISLDSGPDVELGENGVDLPNVSAGAHRLSLSHGADRHTVDIEAGSAPALMAFLVSDQDIGTLLIVTGEDKVQIYLNNQLQNRTTQGGQLRIPNLTPKDYVVRPVKDGFQSIPPQQVATLRRGEQPRLTFKLELIPHLSSLAVVGGSAGTEIFLDGTSAGTIQPDGTFQLATVSPGDHGIELRKAGFVHKMLQRHFTAGSPVTLNRSDLTLEPVTSQLKVIFSPADALVTLTKTGGSPTKLISGGNLSLEPGKYQLTARVGNFSRSAPVELVGGESRTVGPLSLAPGRIQDFDNPATWKPNKEWFVRRGGGFTLYKTSPTSGTFVFSAMLQKGHRLQWVFNYTDDNNYDLFQIDENFFYRSEVRNGQTSEGAKVAFQTEKKKPRTLQITVTPNRIVHQIQQGDAWANLDSWSQPGVNLSSGKFGFYLPGNDEIALSNFSHYADLNIR